MFEDSLFASTARRNRRRGWAAALSFAVQAVVLGVFVLVPLLYTDALPITSLRGYIEIPPPPGRPAPPQQQPVHQAARPRPTEIQDHVLMQPPAIPHQIARIIDPPEPPVLDGPGVIGTTGGIGNGSPVLNDIVSETTRTVARPVNVAPPRVVPLSTGITEGMLIRKVTPPYPVLAKAAGIQGQVMLQATIGHDGAIENLQVISGHPMLVRAALEAVKQWRYRPYLLNNQPVDVETQIIVNFTLAR